MNLGKTTPPIITGENPYRRFRIVLAQAGTAIPTVTNYLLNDLTYPPVTPTFARTGVGVYTITVVGGFAGVVFASGLFNVAALGLGLKVTKTSADVLTVATFGAAGTPADYVGDLYLNVEVWPT